MALEDNAPKQQQPEREFIIPEENLVKVIRYINNSMIPARDANQLIHLLKDVKPFLKESKDPDPGGS